jgi:predicted dienelactone hydrolase
MIRRPRLIIGLLAIVAIVGLWRASRGRYLGQTRQSIPTDRAPAADVAASLTSGQQADGCRTAVGYRVLRLHNRIVAVWYPTTARAARFPYSRRFAGFLAKDAPPAIGCGAKVPLVVFSHGDLGCGIQSVSLTEELARNGYVVAAPDHSDAAICHIVPPLPGRPPATQPTQPKILRPEDWNDTSRYDRRQDVEAVIDGLLENNEFRPVIDSEKIGLAGHSLGGYTVVGMAGGWPSWTDTRIRAVLALSPYVMPFQVKNTLANVRVPLMYQGGTLDVGITPFLKGAKGAYAAANAPVYFVELRNAAHLAWTNCGEESDTESCLARVVNARLIAEYGIAFFNRHLKGLRESILDKENPSLAEYSFRLQHN